MEERIASLEKKIELIEARNKRVDSNKMWETSFTRRLGIAAITYVTMILALSAIHNDQPFINAIIPTLGFMLSTLSLSLIKTFWQNHHK